MVGYFSVSVKLVASPIKADYNRTHSTAGYRKNQCHHIPRIKVGAKTKSTGTKETQLLVFKWKFFITVSFHLLVKTSTHSKVLRIEGLCMVIRTDWLAIFRLCPLA